MVLLGVAAQAVVVPGALYVVTVGAVVFTLAFVAARDYIIVLFLGLLFLPRVIVMLPLNDVLPTIRLSLILLLSGMGFAIATALVFRYRTKFARGSFSPGAADGGAPIERSEELFD